MAKELQPGSPAPDFTLTAVGGTYGSGQEVRFSSLRGHTVVLYFYPKNDTPGCTVQACGLRDHHSAFLSKGVLVFGVCVDSVKSHTAFIAKHGLPFPLLSDEKREVVKAYGVWVEKSMYGKRYMGTERSTFVVEADGTIGSIHRKIQPAIHVQTILKNL